MAMQWVPPPSDDDWDSRRPPGEPWSRPAPGPAGARFLRCPFTFGSLRGVDLSLCHGYKAELISVAVDDSTPSAATCTHLDSAPHPERDAMVAVCRHPEAGRVVLDAPWEARQPRGRRKERTAAPAQRAVAAQLAVGVSTSADVGGVARTQSGSAPPIRRSV